MSRFSWISPFKWEVIKIILCFLFGALAINQFLTATAMAKANNVQPRTVTFEDLSTISDNQLIKGKIGKPDAVFTGMLGDSTYRYFVYIMDNNRLLFFKTGEGSNLSRVLSSAPSDEPTLSERRRAAAKATEESSVQTVDEQEAPAFEVEYLAKTTKMLSGEDYLFDNMLVVENFFHKHNITKTADDDVYYPIVIEMINGTEKYSQTLIVMTVLGGFFCIFCIPFVMRNTIKDIIYMIRHQKGTAPKYEPVVKQDDLEFELEGFYEGVEDGSQEGDFYINTEYNIRKQGTSLETRMREKELQRRAEAAAQKSQDGPPPEDQPPAPEEKPWVSDDFFYSSGTNEEGNFFVETDPDDTGYKKY